MKLRTVIADDERLALRRLEQVLAEIDAVEVVGVAQDGNQAAALIGSLHPDLLVVDIMMPGLTGLELVDAIELSPTPAVIFVTAHENFALAALDEGALGYVLKPIDPQRLERAVERARERMQSRDSERQVAELKEALKTLRLQREQEPSGSFETCLWISQRGRIDRVPVGEITWLEAAGDYVVVHTPEQNFITYDRLTSLESRLDPSQFVRVHRGAIVRKSAVSALERGKFGAVRLELTDGEKVNVGRTYRKTALPAFG